MSHNFLIIGAGHLGARAGKAWLKRFSSSRVVAETLSERSHFALSQMGLFARTRAAFLDEKFPFVLFCVPPSRAGNYNDEVERALSLWTGEGAFLMTSSTAVYEESKGGWIVENSPLSRTPRSEKLLQAEKLVLEKKGNTVRLAGLYHKDRGPHVGYRATLERTENGDAWLNLVHYEDAAELCAIVLEKRFRAEIFLGSSEAIPRRELAKAAGLTCRFVGTETNLGKRCDSTETRHRTGWVPRWKNFAELFR